MQATLIFLHMEPIFNVLPFSFPKFLKILQNGAQITIAVVVVFLFLLTL